MVAVPGSVDGHQIHRAKAGQIATCRQQVDGQPSNQTPGAVCHQHQALPAPEVLPRQPGQLVGETLTVVARQASQVIEEQGIDLVAGLRNGAASGARSAGCPAKPCTSTTGGRPA